MRSRLYRQGVLEQQDFPLEEISEHLGEPGVVVWADLLQPDAATLTQLGDELGLHRLAVEDATHERQRAKVDLYAEHLFLTVYDLGVSHVGDQVDVVARELAVFVTAQAVVTVRKDPGIDLNGVLARWDGASELARHGVSFLLWGLLDTLVDQQFSVVEAIDGQVEGLEDLMFGPAAGHEAAQHRSFQLRKTLLRMRRVILPMREIVNTLIHHELPVHAEAMTPYWLDVYDHVLRTTDWTESIREIVATALETTIALQGNRLTLVTKQVTGWAAIIAVPTAITGFYGENVPFPGAGQPAGFWTSLGLIVVISGLLYVLFRRRDWL